MNLRSIPLLFALFLAGSSLAVAPPAARSEPDAAGLGDGARERLRSAANDATLAPWQRAFMRQVAEGTGPASSMAASRAGNANDGTWTPAAPPTGREMPAAIYDPVRDRMLFFGGNDATYPYRDEVWALSLSGPPAWSLVVTAGTRPPGRFGHTAIYDPVRDRMVIFGGFGNLGMTADTWALSLGGTPAWTELAPAGTLPFERYGHTAIYDPVRDRMIVHGGTGFLYGNMTDVWALSFSGTPTWDFVAAGGGIPAPRRAHTAIYDPVRDRMIIYGGYGVSHLGDVWALGLSGSPAWAQITPGGTAPTARESAGAVYDPIRDRMLLFGGLSDLTRENDVRALSLSGSPAWSSVAPSGGPPAARFGHTLVYDATHDRLVAFAGNSTGVPMNDVWTLDLAGGPTWFDVTPAGAPPPGRSRAMAAYDPVRRRMIVFGGYGNTPGNDLWALNLAGTPAWTELSPSGTPPPGRAAGTLTYDPIYDRMLLIGGENIVLAFDGVWSLSLGGPLAWNQLMPAGTLPSSLQYFTTICDPVRHRMILFGGTEYGTLHGETWGLSLDAPMEWADLTPGGFAPTPRLGHVAIRDAQRDRMLVFGGWDGNMQSDLWSLSLGSGTWTELSPGGDTIAPHAYGTAVYDSTHDRMVVFSGWDGGSGGESNTTWALSLDGTTAWTQLFPTGTPPQIGYFHSAVFDPAGDRMVAYGGEYSGWRTDATWFLETPAVLDVRPAPGASALALATPRPNPSRHVTMVEFDLARSAQVDLEVFDAQGRRVRRIANGLMEAGHHVRAWDGGDEHGHAVGPGLYFVRLSGGDASVTQRIVRVH